MTYKLTSLWRSAFVEPRSDSNGSEQRLLADCYDAMRERAAVLVSRIKADLPHMTIHDVTHLDALWEMASIASGEGCSLNPAEAFVFGGAILLHDAAMTLAAYPGGLSELKQQTEWQDLYARYSGSIATEDREGILKAEGRATEDAIRFLHAKQAENLPHISWLGSQAEKMYLIENQQIRQFYGNKIGKIAYSHWWNIEKVESEFSNILGSLPGVTNCTVDLLRIACLIRVSDAMHLDQRRAPAFEFALTQPTGVAADHWSFQERMARPFVQGDALVFTAQPPFETARADAWWTAFDALQMVDRELRDVDRILRDHQKMPLIVRRVEGSHSPSELARHVETIGWTPVDSTLRVSDVPKIIATLGGKKLYGGGTVAPIREIIQNGLDAVNARRKLQGRPIKWGELMISLENREDGYWLCFEDNGVGMSQLVLTGPLIDFGNSFWKSNLAIQEFPGLASAGMKSRGKYGIGFFSVFILGDHVRVMSRRFDRSSDSAKMLEFRQGLGSRPNLCDLKGADFLLDGGTRIEVKLKYRPNDPGGMLYRVRGSTVINLDLFDLVASIAPACDVAISVKNENGSVRMTMAGDWLQLSSQELEKRINGGEKILRGMETKTELSELRDEEGRIYGRARIDYSDGWSSNGLMTVDGLAANRVARFCGILIGIEDTASRNSAIPLVPPSVLAAWSSEQAGIIACADISDNEKAMAAAIILGCGGDIEDLPIVNIDDLWMNRSEFEDHLRNVDQIAVVDGPIEYDEDDDVAYRSFAVWFEVEPTLARTAKRPFGGLLDIDWTENHLKIGDRRPMEYVQEVILQTWGVDIEISDEQRVVGEVNGTEIYRSTLVYSRHEIGDFDE